MSVKDIKENLSTISANAEFVRLDLDEIYVDDELNVREDYWGGDADDTDDKKDENKDSIEHMMLSIQAVGGITTPMQVCSVEPSDETEGKSYVLNAGFRRYSALKQLAEDEDEPENAELYGKQQPCIIINASSDQEMWVTQLIENLHRKDLNPIEEAFGINRILTNTEGLKASVLAKMLGVSQSRISQYQKIHKELPDSIKDMLSDNSISFSHVREMMSIVPKDSWPEAAKLAKGMPYGKFKSAIENRYSTSDDNGDGDEGKKDGDVDKQRSKKAIRASVIEKIRPYVKDKAENSEDDSVKKLWKTRLDAINWVLNVDDTKMGKDVKEFFEEIEKKEQEAEANKEAESAKKSFIKDCIKQLRELRKAMPADGERKNTLKEDFQIVLNGVKDKVKKIEDEEDEEKKDKLRNELGIIFDIDIEKFGPEVLVPAWNEDVEAIKKRKEAAKKRAEEKRKEKEKEDKEKKEAKGKEASEDKE